VLLSLDQKALLDFAQYRAENHVMFSIKMMRGQTVMQTMRDTMASVFQNFPQYAPRHWLLAREQSAQYREQTEMRNNAMKPTPTEY
jgi:hypothetical protein